jgi:hypothetical protein
MKVPPDCIQVFVQGKDVLMNRGMVLRALVSLASLVIGVRASDFLAAGRALAEFQLNAEWPQFWNLVDHDAKLSMASTDWCFDMRI